ncbi:MAG: superoxide dismutase [Cu-Zn] SodC [Burkholderiaceae bacterium]
MRKALSLFAASALLALAAMPAAHADTFIIMNLVTRDGVGPDIGRITVAETPYGVVFTPDLERLPPGLHGFHVHENPDCAAKETDGKPTAAGAAGGHLDPEGTGRHGAPWGEGHLGDLPPLYVDAEGVATQPVLAPRLELADLEGRSVMIHAGGDNFSDEPSKLGGGGSRIACGVVKEG